MERMACCLYAVAVSALSTLVAVMMLCSPCVASGSERACMPTRKMLKVVWNKCSRLAWYGSLTFS